MTTRTKAGFAKFRAAAKGARIALVAPASPFDRAGFDAGVAELRRLGFEPTFDDRVFARQAIVAGPADVRAASFRDAWMHADTAAVLAVRGGYGSVEILPRLAAAEIGRTPKALVGYSDLTSLHVYFNCHLGIATIHGAMIDRRLAKGPAAYDPDAFVRCLGAEPLGEMAPAGLEAIAPGEAAGPIVGGTLTELVASLGTPYDFVPPPGAVLFIEDVNERPYRLRRALVQLRMSGRLRSASAIVFGQLPGCDEPDGAVTAQSVVAECVEGFHGPVLIGFPSGHTTSPLVSIPFGVHARVIAGAGGAPRVVFDEAAAE